KAIARMHGIHTELGAHSQDLGCVKIGRSWAVTDNLHRLVGQGHHWRMAVVVVIDGHCEYLQIPQGPQHPQRDLSAIGNQYFSKHRYLTRYRDCEPTAGAHSLSY